ncbi:hypothetical protein VTH06DRAFT_4583 [Thermothelomyces fergusii]
MGRTEAGAATEHGVFGTGIVIPFPSSPLTGAAARNEEGIGPAPPLFLSPTDQIPASPAPPSFLRTLHQRKPGATAELGGS